MASNVRLLSIQSDDLLKLKGRLSKADRELMRIATKEFRSYGKSLVAYAQREVPVRTGKLQSSIRYVVKNPDTPQLNLQLLAGNRERPPVVVNTVLFGSRPHVIVPKRPGGVLVFSSYSGSKIKKRGRMVNIRLKGEMVFTRRVNHPGTKPNNFFERAFNETQFILDRLLKNIGRLTIDLITEGD